MIIDTHSHLYDDSLNSDISEVIERAKQEGVQIHLLPNIDVESIAKMKNLHKNYPSQTKMMMGLHPCYIKENYLEELEKIKSDLFQHKEDYIAVGEIGLDFYWDKTFIDQQISCFTEQMKWAMELNLPIAIHSRDSIDKLISILKVEKKIPNGVFHCFTGSYEQAVEILKLGYYLGIGGVITYKNSNLPETIKKIGLERVILETDSPFLPPVPYRGKRNEPSYLRQVVKKLSEIFNKSEEEIEEITSNNAKTLFKIN